MFVVVVVGVMVVEVVVVMGVDITVVITLFYEKKDSLKYQKWFWTYVLFRLLSTLFKTCRHNPRIMAVSRTPSCPKDGRRAQWHMGQFPQDGIWPWVMSFFNFFWKNAVTKPEEQTLFFQLFMRYLCTYITRKKFQVALTPLHYTTLHYNIPLYTTLQ